MSHFQDEHFFTHTISGTTAHPTDQGRRVHLA